jgi:ABC-type transporter Mla subunit MlaD
MNFERQDIGLGLFVSGAAAVVLAGLVLALGLFRGETLDIHVLVDSVANVRRGTIVYVQGYRVGEIAWIEPATSTKDSRLRFDLTLAVRAGFALYEGTRAQIAAPGLVGDAVVNLILPEHPGQPLGDGAYISQMASPGLAEIAARADSLARTVEQVAAGLVEMLSPQVAGSLVDEARITLRATREALVALESRFLTISDSLLTAMTTATGSVVLLSDVVAENRARISSTLDSTQALIGDVRSALRATGDYVAQQRPALDKSLQELDAILTQMRVLTEDLNRYSLWQMLFKVRHPEGEGPPPGGPES